MPERRAGVAGHRPPPRGDFGHGPQTQHASLNRVPIDATSSKITWRFAPLRLEAGHGYSFTLYYGSGCQLVKRTTWAHNQPQVDGGPVTCHFDGPLPQSRMWHVQGEDDRVPECVNSGYDDGESGFQASMPTGWLAVVTLNGTSRYVRTHIHYPSDQPHEQCGANQTYTDSGVEEVYWRVNTSNGTSADEYVCRWTQFAPFGQTVADGWYWGNPWIRERQLAPRDTYLKLEYNPDDDIRTMPDCSGLLYAACEQRVRDAGFTNITRITLNGSDIDFSLPPDGVKRTDPAAGTPIPVNRVVVVYANPPEMPYRAALFKPILRWDTSEDYRPLNVNEFFGEINTADNTPRHMYCRQPFRALSCQPIGSPAQLDPDPANPPDFVHVQGTEGPAFGKDDDAYKTNRSCIGDGIYECESGPAAATYFRRVPGAPDGYEVFDYWYFYRFNRVPDVINDVSISTGTGPLLHEGDWEGVSVGVRPGATVFDYVSFSQHGTWWGYLRDNLECDAGNSALGASCRGGQLNGPWTGRRVHAYVANGTHAGYPSRCDAQFPQFACVQSDGTSETGHDGVDKWTEGDEPSTPLLDLDAAGWVRWPGRWGVDDFYEDNKASGPTSPGFGTNGAHYDQPWERTCNPANPGCAPDLANGGTQSSSARSALECASWMGGAVVALACDSDALSSAVRETALDQPGPIGMDVSRRHGRRTAREDRSASAPGIAQAVGDPLAAGDAVQISGVLRQGLAVMFRLADRRFPVVLNMPAQVRQPRIRTLKVVASASGLGLQLDGGNVPFNELGADVGILRQPLSTPLLP